YDAQARRLVLERGQAVFHVAKGQALPFEVVAGGRTITAHGTVFDVRLDRDAVAVALFEGKVSVSGGPGGRENALLPNQMLTASA
ncbi:FecR domain-containing protein, partial [Klebsiella pneumoniae]